MSAVEAHVKTLAGQGTAIETDVFYTLVPFSGRDFGETFRGATPWPLAEPLPTEIDETPKVVSGAAAQELRRLRGAYLRGELGSRADLFIPIQQSDGARFELRLRDATPFETVEGNFSPEEATRL